MAELSGLGNFTLNEDEQSDIEKRQIRQNYRSLIDDLNRNKEALINPSSEALDEHLSKAEKYYEPVFESNHIRTREAALDSYALNLISNLGKQKAQALNTEFVRFQPSEYADKLKAHLGPQHLESLDGEQLTISKSGWATIGRECSGYFSRFTPLHLLYGSFDPGTVQLHKNIARKPRDKENTSTEQATVPKQISKFGDTEKNEATTEEVERVLGCLRELYRAEGRNPICYFRLSLNPDSYGQAVENIFHLSFLVRDGLAKIYLDDDKLPVIEPVSVEESQALKKENVRTRQCVIPLSPAEWREIVRSFGVDRPTIPTRTPVQTSADSVEDEIPSTSSGLKHSQKKSHKKSGSTSKTSSLS